MVRFKAYLSRMGPMSRSPLSRVVRLAGVALLPVVAMLYCPHQAVAECGSHVIVLDESGNARPPMDHDPAAPKPCHGPNCTGGPKAPAPVPPAPSSVAPDLKALTLPAAPDPGDATVTGRPADSDGMPVRTSDSIFHPPRAS